MSRSLMLFYLILKNNKVFYFYFFPVLHKVTNCHNIYLILCHGCKSCLICNLLLLFINSSMNTEDNNTPYAQKLNKFTFCDLCHIESDLIRFTVISCLQLRLFYHEQQRHMHPLRNQCTVQYK